MYNSGCGDTLIKMNYIVVNNPKAQFSYTANCSAAGQQFNFTNTSIGADPNAHWDFGDGTTFNGTTPPTYTLPAGKDSTIVTLTVSSAATGCTDSYKKTFYTHRKLPHLAFHLRLPVKIIMYFLQLRALPHN